jgi:hypothetical protein
MAKKEKKNAKVQPKAAVDSAVEGELIPNLDASKRGTDTSPIQLQMPSSTRTSQHMHQVRRKAFPRRLEQALLHL